MTAAILIRKRLGNVPAGGLAIAVDRTKPEDVVERFISFSGEEKGRPESFNVVGEVSENVKLVFLCEKAWAQGGSKVNRFLDDITELLLGH